MRTSDFGYSLPPELIAQTPVNQRDQSRLLVLDRTSRKISHCQFFEIINFFQPADLLVFNNSKVIPARLRGTNEATGGEFEILLLEENALNDWWAMVRPGKRARLHTGILLNQADGNISSIWAKVTGQNAAGHRRLQFFGASNIFDELKVLGQVPLPPYIERPKRTNPTNDFTRYQTVYAEADGSVAAPTAGLHFTEELLQKIRSLGIQTCPVTLHVGAGTFAPVKVAEVSDHRMHEERFAMSEDTAAAIRSTRDKGGRIIAVGTTTIRVLESVAATYEGQIVAGSGRTGIFIYPPYRFQVVDALLTNFHLPHSTLLMLASAFAAPGEIRGREIILDAYAEAIRQGYRFFSYGDAMLML